MQNICLFYNFEENIKYRTNINMLIELLPRAACSKKYIDEKSTFNFYMTCSLSAELMRCVLWSRQKCDD